jgi:CDP-paratose 2-epimerase
MFQGSDIPTVVLRMSCIYGTRQFGIEEQGWLSHFTLSILRGEPITIYGDGTQVRDVLFIDDYVRLLKILVENKDKVRGNAFNIGGGDKNKISVKEAISTISEDLGLPADTSYADWRKSDQKYYVSDISKIRGKIGWEPEVDVAEGLRRLEEWSKEVVDA